MSMTIEQEKMLSEVHTAIVGNEKIGHVGIASRVTDLEQKEKNRSLRQAGQTGFFTAIGLAITEAGRWLFNSHH